jgi:exonuclease SbcC
MIPLKLTLQNFLAYRYPDPIIFDGIHLACLTGANGAGKSSLLDAITWALWGKARGKTMQELIHSGQKEMSVELEFEHEGNVYRVLRKLSKQAVLTWHVRRADGTLQSLNEPSLRETQHKIIQLLKLDYETFTASAFLQQGKADAFTTKTPAERKRLLADILGLAQWETYEARVKAILKELDGDIKRIEGRLHEIDVELAQEPALQRDLKVALEQYEALQAQLEEAQRAKDELITAPSELKNAQTQHAQMLSQQRRYKGELETTHAEIAKHDAEIAQWSSVLEAKSDIEARLAELQVYKTQEALLGEQLRLVRHLEAQRTDCLRAIQEARASLERELATLDATMRSHEVVIAKHNPQALYDHQAQQATLEAQERERDALHEQLQAAVAEHAIIKATQETLKQDGEELKERIAILDNASDAVCPTCGQPLSADLKRQTLEELNQQLEAKRSAWADARDRTRALADKNKQIKTAIEQLGDALAELPRLRAKLGALEKQRKDSEDATAELHALQLERNRIQARLESADYAHDAHEQLVRIERELESIGYDSAVHDELSATLKTYQGYEEQKRALERAQDLLPKVKEIREGVLKRQHTLMTALSEVEATLQEIDGQIRHYEAQVLELGRREQAYKAQHAQTDRARAHLQGVQQRLYSLQSRRERKQELEAQREQALVDQSLYDELRLAFGKNGVPAMIIESAIPELELLANDLLGRMTDGRMHLRMETQRTTQDGNVNETLDIHIADELGTRAYEMYSGGEAFRVNFALRVALSKLLARRAGAQLQALFIDEGFGTQDAEGRSKLVEAITAVQEDFRLILVITHIDELRDSFPVHVVVEKTAQGSAVNIR